MFAWLFFFESANRLADLVPFSNFHYIALPATRFLPELGKFKAVPKKDLEQNIATSIMAYNQS